MLAIETPLEYFLFFADILGTLKIYRFSQITDANICVKKASPSTSNDYRIDEIASKYPFKEVYNLVVDDFSCSYGAKSRQT
jgi:hypothetical protein